jgi:hypothetical protein
VKQGETSYKMELLCTAFCHASGDGPANAISGPVSTEETTNTRNVISVQRKKHHGLSRRANYTDQASVAIRLR